MTTPEEKQEEEIFRVVKRLVDCYLSGNSATISARMNFANIAKQALVLAPDSSKSPWDSFGSLVASMEDSPGTEVVRLSLDDLSSEVSDG